MLILYIYKQKLPTRNGKKWRSQFVVFRYARQKVLYAKVRKMRKVIYLV